MVAQRAAREGQRGGLSLRLREVFSWARRYWLEVLGAGVVVLAPVGWWVLRSPDRRSADETVDEFFAAQRDGDCERLVGLVTESSWSNGGRWSRDEFVDHCTEALDGYEPSPENLAISIYDEDGDYLLPEDEDDGDRALVQGLSGNELWSVYRRGARVPGGSLVRVDGEWKVEIDGVVLRIGRSIHETLSGYVAAYNDGDCGLLIGYLSEQAWSADGELDRDDFQDRCADATEARHDRRQPPLELRDIEVRFDDMDPSELDEDVFVARGADQATALVDQSMGPSIILGAVVSDPEEALLVQEGILWKLDGSETRPRGVTPDVQLAAVRYAELQAMFPQEIERGGTRCDDYSDAALRPNPPDEIQFELAIMREWDRCPDYEARVTLYQFADDVQARRAAQRMAAQRRASDESVELASQVPDVPGIPADAYGAGSTAVAAHSRLVVEVDTFLGIGDLRDSARNLVTQLQQL
jgi:hypothetical protein